MKRRRVGPGAERRWIVAAGSDSPVRADGTVAPAGPGQGGGWFDFVDAAFVINLDRRKDRWARMQEELATAGINRYERFAAMDGFDLGADLAVLAPRARRRFGTAPRDYRDLTRGGLGSTLSHRALWQRFLSASPAERILVLEDDARVTPHCLSLSAGALRDLLGRVPGDADLVLLGGRVLEGCECDTQTPGITRVFFFIEAHAYVVSRRGAAILAHALATIRTYIDQEISRLLLWRPDLLVGYRIDPPWFVYDESAASDIAEPFLDEAEADRIMARHLARGRRRLWRRFGIRCRW
jgi:Glycosyltransferase family 25 (LPS biosynthesis protein)